MLGQKLPEKQAGHDFRIKIAASITGINAILTGIKFVLYYYSGSMAILAEAWHSFDDIATSLLVFITLYRGKQCDLSEDIDTNRQTIKNRAELFISLGIGIMLAIIASFLIYRFFISEPQPIDNSLISGLIFLVFSLISYSIYRFEIHIGEKEKSIGLVSDGMHSRADMMASLITGFALILYTMGLNLDRWVSLLIALFVFSFAVETIANVVMDFFRDNEDSFQRQRFSRILSILFNKQAWQEKSISFQSYIETRFKSTRFIKIIHNTFLILPVCIIVAFCLSSAFFTIGIHEKAVVERFGKPVNLKEPKGPGLHIKWPWPIDQVVKVNASYIEEMNIGNIVNKQSLALLWTKNHGTEEPFLTGDNNFFYPYIILHYRIKEVFQYLYKNFDPKKTVNETAHRIATHLFSNQSFYDIASTNREKLEQDMFKSLQACLDDLETGIEIISVNFKDIHPPISVADSFEKVIAGYQDKQKIINDALGYQYKIIPGSRANAAKEMVAAKGYIVDRVKKAEGDSSHFIMSMPGTKVEKEVSMTRIHLDTVKEALKDKRIVVIDEKIGTTDILMDFEGIFQKNN